MSPPRAGIALESFNLGMGGHLNSSKLFSMMHVEHPGSLSRCFWWTGRCRESSSPREKLCCGASHGAYVKLCCWWLYLERVGEERAAGCTLFCRMSTFGFSCGLQEPRLGLWDGFGDGLGCGKCFPVF